MIIEKTLTELETVNLSKLNKRSTGLRGIYYRKSANPLSKMSTL